MLGIQGTGKLKRFFHGTQFPVHELSPPFLDPNKASGRDKGDPQCPHVFLTPNRLYATLFAFKTRESMISGFLGANHDTPYLVYSAHPASLGTGYVYAVSGDDHPDLHEITIDGMRTGKYVTYQPVNVSAGPEQTLTGDINDLMERDNVQVFVLQKGVSKSAFFNAWEACRGTERSDLLTLLDVWRSDGRLLHLNRERNLCPYSLVL